MLTFMKRRALVAASIAAWSLGCGSSSGSGGATPSAPAMGSAGAAGMTGTAGAAGTGGDTTGTCASDDADPSKGTVHLEIVDDGTTYDFGERGGGFAWDGAVGKPFDSVTWGKCHAPTNAPPVEPGVKLETEAPQGAGTFDVTQSQMSDVFEPSPSIHFDIPAAGFDMSGLTDTYIAGFDPISGCNPSCGSGMIAITSSDAMNLAGSFDVVAFKSVAVGNVDATSTKHFQGTFSATPMQKTK